ncbi:Uncharacterised protein [Xylophilus ampelinus]|nr:Uncharacterised protein [Xylophilus ampelinus]
MDCNDGAGFPAPRRASVRQPALRFGGSFARARELPAGQDVLPNVRRGYTARMKFAPLCVLACALVLPLAASAQWQWIDNQGKKVFSDQPPPADVPDKNVLRRPGGKAAPAAPSADAPKADAAATPTSKAAGVDKELEEKARKAEEAEKAKRAAEEQKVAKAKADNCNRARQGKATMDSGMRVARLNDKGEREIMDDQARAAEQRRLQDIINADCK